MHNSAGDLPPEIRHAIQCHVQLVKEGKRPSQEHIDTVRRYELGLDKLARMEDNSDYDSQFGPSSPGWIGMTSAQSAIYHARTPRESNVKCEEEATVMMMQGSSDLHDCESTVGIDTDAALSILTGPYRARYAPGGSGGTARKKKKGMEWRN